MGWESIGMGYQMNRTLLITGAAGGIGRATIALFVEKGWQVIGVDRADFGDDFPTNGLFIKSDISRPEDMQAIFEKAHQFTDGLDALVNNAAVQVAKPITETTVEEWDAAWEKMAAEWDGEAAQSPPRDSSLDPEVPV